MAVSGSSPGEGSRAGQGHKRDLPVGSMPPDSVVAASPSSDRMTDHILMKMSGNGCVDLILSAIQEIAGRASRDIVGEITMHVRIAPSPILWSLSALAGLRRAATQGA